MMTRTCIILSLCAGAACAKPAGPCSEREFAGGGKIPETVLTYEYDASGRIARTKQKITLAKEGETTERYSYDDRGRLSRKENNHGLTTVYELGPDGKVKAERQYAGKTTGKPVKTVTYGYDGKGRKISEESLTREGERTSKTYEYDASGRLAREREAPGENEGVTEHTYDPVGRLAKSVTRWPAQPPETVTYRYDGDGNLVEKVAGAIRTEYDWSCWKR
jgi:YD repeat-containing protein